jgi:hypothetical protein
MTDRFKHNTQLFAMIRRLQEAPEGSQHRETALEFDRVSRLLYETETIHHRDPMRPNFSSSCRT